MVHGPSGPRGPQPTELQPELTQKPSSCRLAFPSPLSIAQRDAVPCPGSRGWSTNQLLFLGGWGWGWGFKSKPPLCHLA